MLSKGEDGEVADRWGNKKEMDREEEEQSQKDGGADERLLSEGRG